MKNDHQTTHHLYWILVHMELIKPEDRQDIYAKLMDKDYKLSPEVCEEIDKLVVHIKTNY